MSIPDVHNTCPTCSGQRDEENLCTTCMDTGALPLRGIAKILKHVVDEQASQREDLTSALTAIWNKVKDL